MKILLVDDHPLFREGLKFMLRDLDSNIDILQASALEEAAESHYNPAPDLILLDMKLPGISGIDAIRAVRAWLPTSRVVVLSGEVSLEIVNGAIEAGAMGYIPKTASPEVLLGALRLILANGVYLPVEIMRAAEASAASAINEHTHVTLTARQLSVLQMVIQGAANKTIARTLNIGEATVKTHVGAVLRILGARNRTEAVYVAAKNGIRFE
ncbi:MAG TPA: response regulator transcription factor [Spongiibacteraceae bacterium]|jgi:DNA-binding NarL/FixJ family response regulator